MCSAECCRPAGRHRCIHEHVSALQALQAALRREGEPILLVLDNVSRETAAAALPYLAPRASKSLLLATSWYAGTILQYALDDLVPKAAPCTGFCLLSAALGAGTHYWTAVFLQFGIRWWHHHPSWYAGAFHDLCREQSMAGHQQLTHFQPLSMATALPLQHQHAVQLIREQLQRCREAAQQQQQPLPPEQLTQLAALAERAAAALTFSSAPAFVPKVLTVSAWTLGCAAEQPDALENLLADLQAAREPSAPGASQPSAPDAVFSQLRACFSRRSPAAQQIFIDLHLPSQLYGRLDSLEQLALWLSCRQAAPCTMEAARAEVSCCSFPPAAMHRKR